MDEKKKEELLKRNWDSYEELSHEDVVDVINSGVIKDEKFIKKMFCGPVHSTMIKNLLAINQTSSAWGSVVFKFLKQAKATVLDSMQFVFDLLEMTDPKDMAKVYEQCIGNELKNNAIRMSAIFDVYPRTFEGCLKNFEENLDMIADYVAINPEKLLPVVYDLSPRANKLLDYMYQQGYDITEIEAIYQEIVKKADREHFEGLKKALKDNNVTTPKSPTPKRPAPEYRKGPGGKTYVNYGNGFQKLK